MNGEVGPDVVQPIDMSYRPDWTASYQAPNCNGCTCTLIPIWASSCWAMVTEVTQSVQPSTTLSLNVLERSTLPAFASSAFAAATFACSGADLSDAGSPHAFTNCGPISAPLAGLA